MRGFRAITLRHRWLDALRASLSRSAWRLRAARPIQRSVLPCRANAARSSFRPTRSCFVEIATYSSVCAGAGHLGRFGRLHYRPR